MFKKILLVASSVIGLSALAGFVSPFTPLASAFSITISEVSAVKTSNTTVKVSWKYCETLPMSEVYVEPICSTPTIDFTGGIKNPITGAPSNFDVTQYNAQYSATLPNGSTRCGANQTVTLYVRSAGHNGDLYSPTCGDINGNLRVQDSSSYKGKNCDTDYSGDLVGECKAIQSCTAKDNSESDCRTALQKCITDGGQVSVCQNEISKGNMTFDPKTLPDGSPEPVCGGGLALSWILCPLTEVVQTSIASLADFIQDFMHFDPLIGSAQGNAILSVWRMVVGIANLLLVIAFLIVIFSQATSIGLSAYGIKKMLPRIILAAILLNISFYICAVAVDVANILGGSIQGIITNATNAIPAPDNTVARAAFSGEASNYGEILFTILTGITAAAVLAATGHIAFIVPILLTAIVSLFFLLLVLAIRHILTVLLIIISPLAFAAMILPNTDGFFKKWWKAFYISLALYPVIMALAYGSMLVAKIILIATPTGDGLESIIWQALAFIVLFAWIWALKFIVSWGGGVAGRLAGMVNNPNKGIIDKSKNWAAGHRKMRKEENQAQALRYSGGGKPFLKPYYSVRKGIASVGVGYRARQGAASENIKDQQRKHIIGRVGSDPAFAERLAGPGASEQDISMMRARYESEEDKMHAQAVSYVQQGVRKNFDAKDRDADYSEKGLRGMAMKARAAAAQGDQTTLDALYSFAAAGGADEYAMFHKIMQRGYASEDDEKNDVARSDNYIPQDMFQKSMAYVSATQTGEIAPKSPALAAVLQKQDPSIDIKEFREGNLGMRKMYNKVAADKLAVYSSDQAKSAAVYATDEVLKELIENPGGKHSLGDGARAAYQAEYDKMMAGTRQHINGVSYPTAEPPKEGVIPKLEYKDKDNNAIDALGFHKQILNAGGIERITASDLNQVQQAMQPQATQNPQARNLLLHITQELQRRGAPGGP